MTSRNAYASTSGSKPTGAAPFSAAAGCAAASVSMATPACHCTTRRYTATNGKAYALSEKFEGNLNACNACTYLIECHSTGRIYGNPYMKEQKCQ